MSNMSTRSVHSWRRIGWTLGAISMIAFALSACSSEVDEGGSSGAAGDGSCGEFAEDIDAIERFAVEPSLDDPQALAAMHDTMRDFVDSDPPTEAAVPANDILDALGVLLQGAQSGLAPGSTFELRAAESKLRAAILFLDGYCDEEDDESASEDTFGSTDPDPPDDAPDDTAGAPPDLHVGRIGRIALSPTGVGEGVGSFGQEAESVLLEVAVEMAAAGLGGPDGSPTSDSGYHVDDAETSSCYRMEVRKVTWEDFTVILQRDENGARESLVGWVVGDNDGVPTGLTTPEGIGIGTPSTTVEAIFGPGAFGDTDVGRSLFATHDIPAIRGITDAPYPDGDVTIMAAGTDCLTVAP